MLKPQLELRASYGFTIFLLFLYGVAVVILWTLALPRMWVLSLTLCCLVSFWVALSRQALRFSPSAIVKLSPISDQYWMLVNRRGDSIEAKLCGESLITRYVMLLNFKPSIPRRRIPIVLLPDMSDQESLRRIRVYLLSSSFS